MSSANDRAGGAPLLKVEGLRKSFFSVEVLKGVSFTLEAGKALGVIGENGSGKSTTMNIINGLLPPSAGTMAIDGRPYAPANSKEAARAGIAFIHQELNLFENLSIAENLALRAFPRKVRWLPQIDKAQMRTRAAELLRRVDLDLSPDMLVNRLAPGERQLVEIAKALSGEARIIVFDEPTTSLTSREAERLFALVGQLKARGLGVIYISHILEDVLRLCDDVVTLRDGTMVDNRPAAGATTGHLIESMLGRPIAELFPPRSAAAPRKEVALDVRGLTQPGIVHNLDFRVMRGEIVGIAGLMGSGRSETARILFGLDPALSGTVAVNGTVIGARSPRTCMAAGMAFLTEDRRGDGLLLPEGVLTNIELARLADLRSNAAAPIPRAALDRDASEAARSVRIKAHDLVRQPVLSLSGGNQQKVVLAKWLLREPAVFILDEPTRGIDVGAKAEIYGLVRQLAERGTGVLIISSEVEELLGVCDRVLTMAHGEIVAEFTWPALDRAAILRAAMQRQEGAA
ncbi:sugar ABC transporter ATP-binding protein [Kaistia algarum]|uniref:sugar ABC transporter ATP-binding protein n=1 Tax=Kaistia algarum TaxID=2083279 RepID=UPI000CE88B39|nr:sugar ABC transporter ATP-binding protein [Kaistia algarum]MCX5512761.1 sugar ABC transporter ATP-binding protein [Kaistia algarum]PPE81739.1 sugar ABC transporter ATP-binding protein [Kaistia algarum]